MKPDAVYKAPDAAYKAIEKLASTAPGKPVKLAHRDPSEAGEFNKQDAAPISAENVQALDELAYRLYAENTRSLLIVLQGMDTAGKDGVIRHVMTGINPQCAEVVPFKRPSDEELDHDFLWRVHKRVPPRGSVGIFNRSHYEDVLVVRVDNLVPPAVWEARFEAINSFERLLTEGKVTVLKFFLHISKEEQLERLQARLDDPTKRWKFSKEDVNKGKQWDDYVIAYEDALTRCNTKDAPWHIIPANRKWFRNLAISTIIRHTLEEMNPQFPVAEPGLDGMKLE